MQVIPIQLTLCSDVTRMTHVALPGALLLRYPWKFRSDEVFFLNFQRPYGGEVGFLTLLCIFLHMS